MADQPRKKAEDALLMALACGASVDQAARQCGLSSRTVYRRLAEPDFRHRLQALRGDMVSRTGCSPLAVTLDSRSPPASPARSDDEAEGGGNAFVGENPCNRTFWR